MNDAQIECDKIIEAAGVELRRIEQTFIDSGLVGIEVTFSCTSRQYPCFAGWGLLAQTERGSDVWGLFYRVGGTVDRKHITEAPALILEECMSNVTMMRMAARSLCAELRATTAKLKHTNDEYDAALNRPEEK